MLSLSHGSQDPGRIPALGEHARRIHHGKGLQIEWESVKEEDEGFDRLKEIEFYQHAAPSYKTSHSEGSSTSAMGQVEQHCGTQACHLLISRNG